MPIYKIAKVRKNDDIAVPDEIVVQSPTRPRNNKSNILLEQILQLLLQHNQILKKMKKKEEEVLHDIAVFKTIHLDEEYKIHLGRG